MRVVLIIIGVILGCVLGVFVSVAFDIVLSVLSLPTPRELLGNPNQKSLINWVIIVLPGAFQISGCIAGGLVAARLTKRKHGGKTAEELKAEGN
jgi:ABC-type antimicrobial peptide transport system permease subunit